MLEGVDEKDFPIVIFTVHCYGEIVFFLEDAFQSDQLRRDGFSSLLKTWSLQES